MTRSSRLSAYVAPFKLRLRVPPFSAFLVPFLHQLFMVPLHLHGACARLRVPPLSAFMVLFLRPCGALCTFTVPIIFGNINLRPSLRQVDGSLFYGGARYTYAFPAPFLGACARLN